MDLSQLKYLLNKYNLKPRRQNGQNFLISDKIVEKIIATANLTKKDTVLEIGAGFGAITSELCKQAGRVIAVEQDRDLMPILNKLALANKNLTIINADIFQADLKILKNKKFKIVANIPFNITSLVFRHFLEHGPRPQTISVLIQKEVAERIVADAGQHSLLSLSVQLFGIPKIEKLVKRSCFYPEPNVDCAVLSINVKNDHVITSKGSKDLKKFFRLLKIGFSAKRKKLANNIANGLTKDKENVENILKMAKISENTRAQELSIKKWLTIFDLVKQFMI